MSLEQFLIYIVIALISIIVGGAGGQAIIRRAFSNVDSSDISSSSAAAAAAAAASAASSANIALINQIASMKSSLDDSAKTLIDIEKEQSRLAQALEGYCEVCRTRHEAIEQRETQMQKEIDERRAG